MREDPHPVTGFFLRRPMMGAFSSGQVITAWLVVGQIPLWIAGLVGVGVFAMQWLIWREGGPGHRWRKSYLRRSAPR